MSSTRSSGCRARRCSWSRRIANAKSHGRTGLRASYSCRWRCTAKEVVRDVLEVPLRYPEPAQSVPHVVEMLREDGREVGCRVPDSQPLRPQ